MLAEIERFIDWVRMRCPHAKTWRDYKCDLALFAERVGNRDVGEILPGDLDAFVQSQIDRGFKPGTVNRRLAAVTSFYRFLATKGGTVACPVLPRRHYLREPQRLPRPLNEQDLRTYFGAIQDIRDRAMFTLMLRCGLRIGEVSALQLDDLYLGESPARMIVRGKGARERTMYLSPAANRILQAWLDHRPKCRDKHVFLSYQKKSLSTTSITKRINYVCKVSGVTLTAHRLRHTFADHLLSAGTPITSIQKLMGHRSVETTQIYAMANDRQVRIDFYQASEKLEGWTLLWESLHNPSPDILTTSPLEESQGSAVAPDVIVPTLITQLPTMLRTQLESYRRWKANRWRPERIAANSTLYYSQQGILWNFFYDQCGVTSVTELQLEHVQQFVKLRLEAGRSARTVNGSLSSLRSFLTFLKEDNVPVHLSLDHIQRLKESERLPRYLARGQVLRLKNEIEAAIRRAEHQDQRHDALLCRAIFYLLWQGGLRSGEVELLRFCDFWVSRSNEANRLFIQDSKWRRGRTVYLTDVAFEALKAYLAVRGTDPMGGFVFIRQGRPLQRHFILQRLSAIGKKIDVDVSAHRLRHTFATQLLNVGCQVTSIQRLLGHTNLNTTMTYARAFDHTVMLDYFRAADAMERQPEGAWFALGERSNPEEETKNQASETS
jgi:site-specific recombinase XerD